MDQMTCDKLMNVATFPDGKKFAFYNGLKHKIDHLKVDHAYDAMKLVGELKVVLDMFSNLLMSDPILSSTTMDIMPTLDQLKIHATNALPMVTESSMEMINTGLMNLEPALGYDMVTEQDMTLAHDAFMPFLNRDVNNVPFDMLANDINNVNMMMNMGGGYMNGFDAHMLSNLEIYDRSADFVEAASIYQTVWDMMHMQAMPPMPPEM